MPPTSMTPAPLAANSPPSAVLRFLSTSLAPETVLGMLEKYLYPVIDALPSDELSKITDALVIAHRDRTNAQQKINKIGYEEHKASLSGDVKDLLKHVKRDWHDGYEEQSEMMSEIAEEILGWLPDLWQIAVEDGLELSLIQKCLVLCSETVNKIERCNSRAEFSDGDFAITIKTSDGRTVYDREYAYIGDTLTWMWRELLIAAVVRGGTNSAAVKEIKSSIERLKLTSEVSDLIRCKGEVEHSVDDDEYHDRHWTQAMKDAGFQLHAEYTEARIASFKRKPSFLLYNALVAQSPDLQPALLDITRKHVFSRETPVSMSYADAADIFQKTSKAGDLVRLLGILPRFTLDPAVPTTKRKVVSYLSKQSSEEFRQRALSVIERELRHAKENVVSECERAFPGYEDAFDYLEEMIDEGLFSKKAPQGNYMTHSEEWTRRDNHLSTFVDRACRGYDGDRFNDYDDDMIGVDEDDSDYEEEKEGRQPNLERAIEDWIGALREYPDKAQAAAIWDRLRETDSEDLLFSVDGSAEALADRCDWEYSHSGAKQYIADGLRAMYRNFTCANLIVTR